MKSSDDNNLALAQQSENGVSGQHRFVDIHCHCLPGVDDGPATMAEALALCSALVDDGITTVIATPHQLGKYSDLNEAEQTRAKVSALNDQLKSNQIPLALMAGGDVRVDERISQLLGADKILTLADGGKYILLELPHQVFIDIEPLLAELASAGLCPIISHPERHPVLAKQPQVLLKWLDHSSYLQITAASLLGGFGSMAEKAAWNLLSSGWACLVATDAHDLKARRPCMTVAFEQISLRLGKSAAQLVCIENPLAVSQGSDIGMLHSVSARNSGYERDHNNS